MEGGGGAGDAALRLFRVSVDVRSFKAGVRLPMRAVNAFVKVVLPPEIVKLALESGNPGSNAAKLSAPLRSHPPILVERCSEVTIPNGYVALELPVSVLGLAATLAQDPHLLAEVYHRDRYAADSVIGIARISMAPLMHEPRLDGYVTLRNEKQVTTGSIRIVLAAEELGPVTGLQHKRIESKEPSLNHPCPGLEESFLILKNNISQYLGSKAVAVQTDTSAEGASKKNGARNTEKEKATAATFTAAAAAPAVQHEKPSVSFQPDCIKFSKDVGTSKDEKNDDLREHVEYELAWEFEMWRRSEEARWRAELKEKEVATIKALEEESKKKQKDQAAALDKVRLELANLEAKLRTKLLAVEKRDRALVLAEEEAALRKEALQRECAQRIADAENATKRLQADFHQRTEMEHGKFVMLQQQYAAVEQRLASTNATLATVEKEFAAYKSAQRLSSEADLAAQILVLKHQCHELEKKADATAKTRDEYKAQVIRIAKELANMRKRSQESPPPPPPPSSGWDTNPLTALLEDHLRKASEDKVELKRLKEQVERLQQQEQTAVTAAAAAAAAAATAAVSRGQVNNAANKEAPVATTSATAAKAKESEPGESKHEHKEAVVPATSHPAAEPEQSNPVPQKPPRPPPPPPPPPPAGELYERLAAMDVEHTIAPSFDDTEPFLSQITAFQRSEIVRLTKQKADLLQTGVYTINDRIIRGLDEEIRRLRSIDTAGLCLR